MRGGSWVDWKVALASLIVIGALFFGAGSTEAHHTGQKCGPNGAVKCLPLLPSPFMSSLNTQSEILWCLNDRAAAYPGFASQARTVHNQISASLGIPNRQVSYGTPQSTGCWIKHDFTLNHGCTQCAAWVHYLNTPILIEYNEKLMYSDWRTTLGHELGHGIAGIHEQYDDANFKSHIRTYGYWATNGTSAANPGDPTVMDFGTNGLTGFPEGVWEWQMWDLARACEVNDPQGQRYGGCMADSSDEWGECENVSSGWRCWSHKLQLWVWLIDRPTVWVAAPFGQWFCTEGCP